MLGRIYASIPSTRGKFETVTSDTYFIINTRRRVRALWARQPFNNTRGYSMASVLEVLARFRRYLVTG